MSELLAGRVGLQRAGRANGWLLKLLTYVGYTGLSLSFVLNLLLPEGGAGWRLLLLGGSLILGGAAHAFSGENEGTAARLLTGLTAAGGGLLLLVATLAGVRF